MFSFLKTYKIADASFIGIKLVLTFSTQNVTDFMPIKEASVMKE
ncbi:hypothetical protein [uncultured Mucilaginibacter sp.]|nr:hypothetical protein [uncultured Mucilaginibacter sp.]